MSDEASSPAQERSAGFVVATMNSGVRKFLLLRHRGGGHWAFPKGRIEDAEDPLLAAKRETMEETGIGGIEPIPGFSAESSYRFEREGRSVDKRVVYYLAEVENTQVTLSREHEACRWLPAAEVRRLLTFEESRRILERAIRWLDAVE